MLDCAYTRIDRVSHMARSPVVGRTLADHGATVLKIISHERPRREMFDCETNHGKRTLVLELSTAEGKQRLWDLLKVRAWIAVDGLSDGVRDELRHQADCLGLPLGLPWMASQMDSGWPWRTSDWF